MSTKIQTFIQTIKDKRPADLLNPKYANNLYQKVPTDAEFLEGLKMMTTKKKDDKYVRFTAYQPPQGTVYAVAGSQSAPVGTKLGYKTEERKLVRFAETLPFEFNDLEEIYTAMRADARDAELEAAATKIARNASAIKFRKEMTIEKLFWEGCMGRMDVDQMIDGAVSEDQISTYTRQQTALTSTAVWDYTPATSTASPMQDLDDMADSYTGKGLDLKEVWMNRETFNYFKWSANTSNTGVVDILKHTDPSLIFEAAMTNTKAVRIPLPGGLTIVVYNATWIKKDGTEQKFIPDGYIVGMPQQTNNSGEFVTNNKYMNVDAIKNEVAEVVHGTYFDIMSEDNPKKLEFFLSHCGLPIFENPQAITYQQVYS